MPRTVDDRLRGELCLPCLGDHAAEARLEVVQSRLRAQLGGPLRLGGDGVSEGSVWNWTESGRTAMSVQGVHSSTHTGICGSVPADGAPVALDVLALAEVAVAGAFVGVIVSVVPLIGCPSLMQIAKRKLAICARTRRYAAYPQWRTAR
jgi:hypothetical protein